MRKWKPRTEEQKRKKLEKERRYRVKHPEKWSAIQRRAFMKCVYGITADQFEAMKANQGGKCAICRRDDRMLVVDHCHKTKVFRGLLCRSCNVALGAFGDDVQGLEAAIEYLKRSQF